MTVASYSKAQYRWAIAGLVLLVYSAAVATYLDLFGTHRFPWIVGAFGAQIVTDLVVIAGVFLWDRWRRGVAI